MIPWTRSRTRIDLSAQVPRQTVWDIYTRTWAHAKQLNDRAIRPRPFSRIRDIEILSHNTLTGRPLPITRKVTMYWGVSDAEFQRFAPTDCETTDVWRYEDLSYLFENVHQTCHMWNSLYNIIIFYSGAWTIDFDNTIMPPAMERHMLTTYGISGLEDLDNMNPLDAHLILSFTNLYQRMNWKYWVFDSSWGQHVDEVIDLWDGNLDELPRVDNHQEHQGMDAIYRWVDHPSTQYVIKAYKRIAEERAHQSICTHIADLYKSSDSYAAQSIIEQLSADLDTAHKQLVHAEDVFRAAENTYRRSQYVFEQDSEAARTRICLLESEIACRMKESNAKAPEVDVTLERIKHAFPNHTFKANADSLTITCPYQPDPSDATFLGNADRTRIYTDNEVQFLKMVQVYRPIFNTPYKEISRFGYQLASYRDIMPHGHYHCLGTYSKDWSAYLASGNLEAFLRLLCAYSQSVSLTDHTVVCAWYQRRELYEYLEPNTNRHLTYEEAFNMYNNTTTPCGGEEDPLND